MIKCSFVYFQTSFLNLGHFTVEYGKIHFERKIRVLTKTLTPRITNMTETSGMFNVTSEDKVAGLL
jgi:hypothetical protein